MQVILLCNLPIHLFSINAQYICMINEFAVMQGIILFYSQLPSFRMLTKEQKMKYGELLRLQIKQREDAKRAQKREHTPAMEPTILPQPVQAVQRMLQHPQQVELNLDRFKSDREAQKQLLAKKMEEQAYNPFGKIGSGAPNKQHNAPDPRLGKPARDSERTSMVDEQLQLQFAQGEQPRGHPMGIDPMRMHPNGPPLQNPYEQFQGYRRIPTPEFLQGAYNNVPFVGQQYAPPAPYGYINANENDINYMGKIEITPRQMAGFEPRYEHQQMDGQMQQPLYYPPPPPTETKLPRKEDNYDERRQRPQQNNQPNRMEEIERDVFRKGGRNLLKFQNEVPEQIISKQNQKLRLQQQLKKQMQQAARRKKQEEQRMREEDQKLQRKNKEFLLMEKKKYEEELNAKKGQAKNVEQANANGKKEQVNLKKEKFQKIREEVAKREQEERRLAQHKEKQKEKQNNDHKHIKPPHPHPQPHSKGNEVDQAESAISNETQMSRGFNTAISKQFFKRQREKSSHQKQKVDKLSSEMEKMRKEIAHQGQFYHREIEKVQREAERVKHEKDQADEEIHRLKQELREKMDYNNKKFLEDIYHGKVRIKDPYYADEVTLEQPSKVNALRPKKSERLVLQEYKPEQHREYEPQRSQIMRNDSEMMSLIGDSKKIPLQIDANESLTLSKLDSFAKDTDYFSKANKKPLQQKHQYRPTESIIEEDERREESRQSNRGRPTRERSEPQEELNKLIESRKKSRGGWGQLSSVNEEMVNQIEQMLQNKQRPKSHLAKAGENSLQSYERTSQNNEVMNRKSTSVSQQEQKQSEGTLNSLDRLIQKYM